MPLWWGIAAVIGRSQRTDDMTETAMRGRKHPSLALGMVAVLLASPSAFAASAGCDAINADTLRLQADTRRIGSSADRAQAIDCLAVGFNGGCFGRGERPALTSDNAQTSPAFQLAAGETIEFAIAKTAEKDVARIVVVEPGTLELAPLTGTSWRVGHSGTYRFELAASGASGHTATARATCVPASS